MKEKNIKGIETLFYVYALIHKLNYFLIHLSKIDEIMKTFYYFF